jgi:salicylate hydroxylase
MLVQVSGSIKLLRGNKLIQEGIQVSSNSSRILRKLGVDKYILPYTTEPVDLKMMRWQDGKVLIECPLKEPAHNEYGSPYWHIHRADLHRGLLECANDLGISLHLGNKVTEVNPDEASLITSSGKKFTADLIVASDGKIFSAKALETCLRWQGCIQRAGQ